MRIKLNVIGKKFGDLTVLKEVKSKLYKHKSGKTVHRRFRCECACGKVKEVYLSALRSGNTTSCGCKVAKIVSKLHTKHGFSVSKDPLERDTYAAWMMTKGNRCKRWDSFSNFLKDIGIKPNRKSTFIFPSNGECNKETCIWV